MISTSWISSSCDTDDGGERFQKDTSVASVDLKVSDISHPCPLALFGLVTLLPSAGKGTFQPATIALTRWYDVR
jgi:hypothetical protein